jgi:ribosomal protein L7Ae-like RNA K-turn-binding protein
MPNDPILHLIGLARKAGRLEIGEEPVGAVCRSRHARLLLLAQDAAANTRRRAAHFGEAGNVLWLEVPYTKDELGFYLGRSSCAMLALTDAGFAATLVEKLAARDPFRYGPAAEQLRTKADRMLQRQREKRQHEKNLREGKAKPWAPPAPSKEEQPAKSIKPIKPSRPKTNGKPKPPKDGGSAPKRKSGTDRSGTTVKKAGPGGRRLTGTFRSKP